MALDLYFAPFLAQLAGVVDQKGAALDTDKFPTVEHFLPDHIELATQFFIGVRQQLKWEFLFFPAMRLVRL